MPYPSQLPLADLLWAKTLNDYETKELIGWLPLPVHLRDTAEIACLLLRHRKSRQQLAVLEASIPKAIDLEALVWLLAALHDIGKAGPNFQAQSQDRAQSLYDQTSRLAADGSSTLNISDCQEVASQSEFPHSLASEIIVARTLGEEFGLFDLTTPTSSGGAFQRIKPKTQRRLFPIVHQFASILGAHHGMTATGALAARHIVSTKQTALLGVESTPWPRTQRDLVLALIDESGLDFGADHWRDSSFLVDRGALSLLSSIVVEADWIASDHTNFPLIDPDQNIGVCEPSTTRASNAWNAIRLPSLWVSVPPSSADKALHSMFDLPPSARASSGQQAAHAATIELRSPALIILEDETGAGKTEAGLMAAANLARATGASGVFFGLPTQATTNGMFSRFAPWVANLVSAGAAPGVSLSLAHGKASLNRDWQRIARLTVSDTDTSDDRPGNGAEYSNDVVGLNLGGSLPDDCQVEDEWDDHASNGRSSKRLKPGTHAWLSGRKKRLLSDFVIGTVDQLLMGAMRSRHLMLRHSGLADKVVIIDEVHAADSTMRLFLSKVLVWLGRWGVPVIVLTATLPPGQKQELVHAYRRGLSLRSKRNSALDADSSHLTAPSEEDSLGKSHEPDKNGAVYPALTVVSDSTETTVPVARGRSRPVEVHEISDDNETLIAKLRTLSNDGGCFAVIRNSVTRVQNTAEILRQEFGDDVVTVAHSRFAASDRAAKDRELLARYGRNSTSRPAFSIVVASQVLEQSLDIDFDAMFTDICPIDLLIQRLGRVHRHRERTRPGPLADPLCFITGINREETDEEGSSAVPSFVRDSVSIYGEHLLLRSLAALRSQCPDSIVASPDDVAALVHSVYSAEPLGPAPWGPTMQNAQVQAERKHAELRDLAQRWTTEPDFDIHGLDDWLNDNDGDPEDVDPHNRERGSVRDGSESIEVLLVLTDGTGWRTLDWLPRSGGIPIPTDTEVPRYIAEAVANSSIRLPFAMSRGTAGDAVIAELEKLGVASWQQSPLLRGQLVLPLTPQSDPLDAQEIEVEAKDASATTYQSHVGGWYVTYDKEQGLSASPVARNAEQFAP